MERHQNNCQHCGAPAAEKTSGPQVFVECTNITGYQKEDGTEVPPCGMRTPGVTASLDYGAWERVTEIWNRSVTGGKGSKADPYPVPQAEYFQDRWYLENKALYLCFKYYKGPRTPSEYVDHYFAKDEG